MRRKTPLHSLPFLGQALRILLRSIRPAHYLDKSKSRISPFLPLLHPLEKSVKRHCLSACFLPPRKMPICIESKGSNIPGFQCEPLFKINVFKISLKRMISG